MREYLVLSARSTQGLENQMQAVGRYGYRAHPWAVVGEPLAAVMERASDEENQYAYTAVETGRTGAFEAELLAAVASGQEVAGATAARRRLYVSGTGDDGNNVDQGIRGFGALFGGGPAHSVKTNSSSPVGFFERRSPLPQTLGGAPPGAPALRLGIDLDISESPGDMEDELNDALDDGYEILSLSIRPTYDGLWLMLQRREGEPLPEEYKVLTTSRASKLEDELNDEAEDGYRLVRGGLFVKPTRTRGLENAVVMQRMPDREPTHEYLVLSTARESTLDEEIAEALLERYEIAGRLYGSGHLAILERPLEEGL